MQFRRFPKDRDLRLRWIRAVCRIDPDNPVAAEWKPTSDYTYICSNHFLESDYEATSKLRRLRRTAVPSVFSFKKKRKSSEPSERDKRYENYYMKLTASCELSTSKEDALRRRLKTYRDKLRNVSKREKRLRTTIASLTNELQEAQLINDDLEERLRVFKGNCFSCCAYRLSFRVFKLSNGCSPVFVSFPFQIPALS